MKVPFGDLAEDYRVHEGAIDSAIKRVLVRGWFILGEELEAFEREFAAYLGLSDVIGCASGTEAISLALQGCGLQDGAEVLVPANTCVPTLTGIRLAGCQPRLMDARESDLLAGVEEVERALTPRTKGFAVVNLYGGASEGEELRDLAERRGLVMIEDCAQSHGSTYRGKKSGTFGHAAAFSFYPTKNLGAYGDGGAVATGDSRVAARVRSLRNYGQTSRYVHEIEGWNSRLDELQAAILREKLRGLDSGNERRRQLARRYADELGACRARRLNPSSEAVPVYHLYPIRVERRDELQKHLDRHEVQTLIHYPIPLHLQPAYAFLGYHPGDFPVSEHAGRTLLSLPIYPTMPDATAARVAGLVRGFLES